MNVKKLSRIMKALSNENRLELYLEIQKQQTYAIAPSGCFVYDIASRLNIGAPTISHHIKELENASLIYTKKIGKQLTASVNNDTKKYILNAFL